MSHLLLQLEDSVHQRLTRRRTPWDIDIHGHDSVTPPRNRIAIMIITPSIRTRPHRDDPSWVRHLVIDLSQRRRHFVGQGAGDYHDVRLARGGAEDYTQAILVVARGGEVHHFYGAAGEAEGHGPQRALTGPIGDLVEGCSIVQCLVIACNHDTSDPQGILHSALFLFLTGQRNFSPWLACNAEWRA